MKIAIKSNKKLQFPPASVGYISMEIDLIQNKPEEGVYELRIIDTCYDDVKENHSTLYKDGEIINNEITVRKVFGKNVRFKTYTYEELSQLGKLLDLDFKSFNSLTDYINELFKQGLLITTQQECEKGLSSPGKGMYFSEASNWVIV